jgi:predicted aminopeptidase
MMMMKNEPRRAVKAVRAAALAILAAALLSGCSTLSYYAQVISGHLEVMRGARTVDAMLRDAATPAELRERLLLAGEIRDFASRELALPDNGSYRRYVDLGRPFVVWNLVSAPELSVKPIDHCFPIAGCVSYRGYYAESDAREQAQQERSLGRDAYVGGVSAYSTLGWFDDPLLNTFVVHPEPELARLIFHELAHQAVYAAGDTVFNESFATVVEEEGVRRWLDRRGAAVSEAERDRYQLVRERRREFVSLVMACGERMDALYRGPGNDQAKRAGKAALIAEFDADYRRLKASWGGFAGYDRILAGGINNALLASIANYTTQVPALAALLRAKHGDLAAFYREVRQLATLPKAARLRRLSAPAVASS